MTSVSLSFNVHLSSHNSLKYANPNLNNNSNPKLYTLSLVLIFILNPVYTIEQTSSKQQPGLMEPPGSNVGLGLAHS